MSQANIENVVSLSVLAPVPRVTVTPFTERVITVLVYVYVSGLQQPGQLLLGGASPDPPSLVVPAAARSNASLLCAGRL